MEYLTIYDSPLGWLYLTAGEDGLTGLRFSEPVGCTRQDDFPRFPPVKQWLDRYFRGEDPPVDFPLCPNGTKFQLQVWDILTRIPYGETITYGQIAKELAQLRRIPKMSAQAVGQAVGANPISIIIPCHRVVGTGGKLTGYAGGIPAKIWLLKHEGILQNEEL